MSNQNLLRLKQELFVQSFRNTIFLLKCCFYWENVIQKPILASIDQDLIEKKIEKKSQLNYAQKQEKKELL